MALEAVYWMAQSNVGRHRVVHCWSSNRKRASSELKLRLAWLEVEFWSFVRPNVDRRDLLKSSPHQAPVTSELILKCGRGHTSSAKGRANFWSWPSAFLGSSKRTIIRVGGRFRDGQYSLVSFCCSSTHGVPSPVYSHSQKLGHVPRTLWSRRGR